MALVAEAIDVSDAKQFLRDGQNVLAIHALNDGISGNDFLIRPTLVGESDAHEVLVQSTTVKARTLDAGVWSALTEADFVAPTPVRVTEIMYHPRDAAAGQAFEDNDFEYVELANISAETIDLADVRFSRGIEFAFADSPVLSLAAGERIVIVSNIDAFTARYGHGYLVAGVYSGRLDNGGERLALIGANDRAILDFSYDDAWYPATDGGGRSLVIVDPLAAQQTWGRAIAWKVSDQLDGSPALPESSGVPGDTDGDADVDLADLNHVRNQFGGLGLGDTDGDRDVDLADLNAVRNHFGAPLVASLRRRAALAASITRTNLVFSQGNPQPSRRGNPEGADALAVVPSTPLPTKKRRPEAWDVALLQMMAVL